MTNGALSIGFTLFCGLGRAVVRGDLRQVTAEKDQGVATIWAEDERAKRIGTERLGRSAALLDGGRNEGLGSHEILGRLRLCLWCSETGEDG